MRLVPSHETVIPVSFVLGSGLSSQAIAWWGQGILGWSHVDGKLNNGTLIGARSDKIKIKEEGKTAVLPPGVQIRPEGYESWKHRAIVEIPCTHTQHDDWCDWMIDQIDKPYDHAAIWSFILGVPMHHKGYWICSACITGSLRHVGLLQKNKTDKNLQVLDSTVTPNELFLVTTLGLGGAVTMRY